MAGLAESPATRAKGWKLFGILLLFWLTPYHTIPTFNNPEKNKKRKKKNFRKHCGKGKMLVTSVFSFSHNVFCPSRSKF